MLTMKSTGKKMDPAIYKQLTIEGKIKHNRFVLAQNKLNGYIEKAPTTYNKIEDTIAIVGSHEYVITTNLTDSFWQRHLKPEKWPYSAFHSPFKGTYIFLRS